MNILVVYSTLEAPAIQNIYFKNPFTILEQEKKINFILKDISQLLINEIREFHLIIISRIFTREALDLVEACKKSGKPVLFFFDDDILHFPMEYYLGNEPFYKNNEQLIIKILKRSSGLVVSTEKLKHTYHEFNENIYTVFPSIDLKLTHHVTGTKDVRDGKFTIGYAGSFGHVVDFKFMETALMDFYKKNYPKIRIEFMGCVPENFSGIIDNNLVKFVPWSPGYENYLHNLLNANWQLGLCPVLESDYTSHKTNIKFLEYSLARIPGIFSNISIYNRDVIDNQTGFLANNNYQDWMNKMEYAFKKPLVRSRISLDSFGYVTSHYSDQALSEAWNIIFEIYQKRGIRKFGENVSIGLNKIRKVYSRNGFPGLGSKLKNLYYVRDLQVTKQETNEPEAVEKVFNDLTRHFDKRIIKKQVLFIIPWLSVGGGDMVNLSIAKQLDPDRFTIHFITTEISNHEWEEKFRKISKNIFHVRSIIQHAEHFWEYNNLILEYIRRAKIDVIIISNSSIGYTCLAALKKDFSHIRIMDILHGQGGEKEGGGFPEFSKPYDSYIHRRITINRYLKNYLITRYDINPDRISVIHNGIDTDKFKRSHKRGQGKTIVTYVGRLSYEKHPEKIVQIAEQFYRKYAMKDICFQIIGDGQLYHQLQNDIENSGVGDIVLLKGYKDNIKKELESTDILILCSEMEGLPIILLEAMSMSIPCIATNVGGIPELIDNGINGYLVDYNPKMSEVFADKIYSLYSDFKLRTLMGEKARGKVLNEFSMLKMKEAYLQLIS